MVGDHKFIVKTNLFHCNFSSSTQSGVVRYGSGGGTEASKSYECLQGSDSGDGPWNI